MLQCVAVREQCVAVCCSASQNVTVYYSVLPCFVVCCRVLQCNHSVRAESKRLAACVSPVLQCVAVCCSVLQRVAACCSALQCVAGCCRVL